MKGTTERPCDRCNSVTVDILEMSFANGTKHLKQICAECGQFRGFRKHGASSYREELYFLAKELSNADTTDFVRLKKKAAELIAKTHD